MLPLAFMDYFKKFLKDKGIPVKSGIKAVIVGVGAIGSISARLLSQAGVSQIKIIDSDIVEAHNLQNQLYLVECLGKHKVEACAKRIQSLNTASRVIPTVQRITAKNIRIIGKPDVVLECTDNFETRYVLNDYCRKNSLAFVHSAAAGSIYQAGLFVPRGSCLRCAFPDALNTPACQEEGLLPGTASAAASLQSTLALRHMFSPTSKSVLIMGDAWSMDYERIFVKKRYKCLSCKCIYTFLNSAHPKDRKLCRSNSYLFHYHKDFEKLKKTLEATLGFKDLKDAFITKNSTVFKDGRILIKAESQKQAKKLKEKILENA